MSGRSWQTTSEQQTLAWGAALGGRLAAGAVLALNGPMGSGKTHLVKGIAGGLKVPPDEPVTSPTFVLLREYTGRLPLYHFDAYRLGSAEELAALGLDDLLREASGVVVVEWADRFPELLPPSTWQITLAHAGPTQRSLTLDVSEKSDLRGLWATLDAALANQTHASA